MKARSKLAASIRRSLRNRFSLGPLLLVSLIALQIADPRLVTVIRFQVFDLLQRSWPRQKPAEEPVAIIDIDEESLKRLGQWPWPRTTLGEIIRRAHQSGAAVIGLDMLLSEADRTSPEALLNNPNIPDAAKAALRGAIPNDQKFADTLSSTPTVLGMSVTEGLSKAEDTPVPFKAGVAAIGVDPRSWLPQHGRPVRNLPVFEEAASGIGMITPLPDADFVIRRIPTVIMANGALVPSLALELIRVALGTQSLVVRAGEGVIHGVALDEHWIPTEADGSLWVRFRPGNAGSVVPAWKVLNDTDSVREHLRGKIVLIGTSASGLNDLRSTPLRPAAPGVDIHAQAIETILSEDILSRPAYIQPFELLLTLLLCLPAALMGEKLKARASFCILFGGSSIACAATVICFTQAGLLMDGSFSVIGLTLMTLTTSIRGHRRAEQEKGAIRTAFSQYLSPAYVEELVKNPDKLKLGGERQELTILFSDVRGYTSLCEGLKDDPERLVGTINDLFTALTEAILATGGTIDKYMGDAVMAFWGAPIQIENPADAACQAALMMQTRLAEVNNRLALEAKAAGRYHQPLGIGIGLNTGQVIVGNMGSQQRFDYSVLGDPVNLASRLEGQSKDYGVTVIVGDETAKALKMPFALLELDLIRVKGKNEPVRIYALIGDTDLSRREDFIALQQAHAAMLTLYRKQQFAAARDLCSKLAADAEAINCPPSLWHRFQDRISHLAEAPPGPGWDGVRKAESK